MKDAIWFRRRWAPWWLAIGLAVFWPPLTYPFYLATQPNWRPTTEIRIIMAIVAVSAYWFLASIANWRIAVVTPSGVRTSLLPFPTGSGQSVRRDSILHCFARHIIETDEMNAYVTADYYAMGVETVQGHQLDIHLPYPTEADALAAARDVAQVLNLNTYGRALDIQSVQTKMTYPTLRRMLLFWSAITFFAVYVGWRCG